MKTMHTKESLAIFERNCELARQLDEAAKIILRLLRYADKTAENHPRAVTSAGQNARVRAGMWLAKYECENASNPKVKAPPTI